MASETRRFGSYRARYGRQSRGESQLGGRRRPSLTSSTPVPPFGATLHRIRKSDLALDSTSVQSSKIENCSLIGSFNWMNTADPTIIVPGEPPKWTPPSESTTLSQDSGQYFRDKNAARFPSHPVEPAIRVALATDLQLSEKLDLVACGSTLGNLLRFVLGEDKTFRMLVETVDATTFLIRRENTATELIPDVRGFGHTFPEASTTWSQDVKGSASHQRLIRYEFGGLRFMVRFEGDGYIWSSMSSPEREVSVDPAHNTSHIIGDIIDTLDSSRLSSTILPSSAKLAIKRAGQLIPQDRVFDLKTRTIKRKDEDFLAAELPRLWVAQIPNFILAFHHHGCFHPAETTVRDVRTAVREWEQSHEADLSILAILIHRIIDLAQSRPDGKLELRHESLGLLEVCEQLPDAGEVLSAECRDAWCYKEKSELDRSDHVDPNYSDDYDSWQEAAKVFTACSADSCGYCGRCTY